VKFPEWSDERLRIMADAEPGGLMACSPELLAELKIMAGTDPRIAASLKAAGIEPENVEKVVFPPQWASAVAAFNAGKEYRFTIPCKNCGAEKDAHYDGSQCPIGNGLYSSEKVFEESK
jgi:hypothetical protein